MTNKHFPTRLRELRTETGMTQTDLARKLGISRSTVGMYELGRREPDFEILDLCADVFNVSVGYLVGDAERGQYPRHVAAYAAALLEPRMPKEISVSLDEDRLIRAYRAANDDVKKAVKAVLRIKT